MLLLSLAVGTCRWDHARTDIAALSCRPPPDCKKVEVKVIGVGEGRDVNCASNVIMTRIINVVMKQD